MAILDTVSSVIERMDNDVGPFAERVVALLPPLWEESGAEHLMKQHIVRLLAHLVSANEGKLGTIAADGIAYHQGRHTVGLSTCTCSCDRHADACVKVTSEYMLDDALDLWIVVVRESASPSSDLLSLLPNLLRDDIRPRLVHALEQAFANKKTESIDAVCETVECLLRAASTLGGEPGTLRMTEDCMHAHLLQGFVDSIHSDYETHQTTGPNRKEPPKDWKNETNYISVLSQIGYGSSHAFRVAIQAWADTRSPPNQDGYKHVIEEFFTHMDAIVDSSKQKLACMALTKQLETDEVFLLGKLQDYIAMWTSVIRSLQGEGEALGHEWVQVPSCHDFLTNQLALDQP
ncbi:hypothetical protein MRB53_040319 [Persea americana]|nr:hypothetical protein MRB53_040319 [Persea americana]